MLKSKQARGGSIVYYTDSCHGHALHNLALIITKWRTIGNELYTATDECIKSYVQGIKKLTCLFQLRYKTESIYIQTKMKGQGSFELALEMQKERKQERMTI